MIEPFVINQQDDDITQSNTTAATMSDWMVYRVPKGYTIILSSEDVLAIDCDTTGAAVCANISQVQLEYRDATGESKKLLLGPMQYASFAASGVGEFKDEDKLIHLEITEPVRVRAREYIAVMIKDATGADKDTTWFELRTHRER